MNISTEHISQSNQTDPPADASERMVDLMNEDGFLDAVRGPMLVLHRPGGLSGRSSCGQDNNVK